MNGGKKAKYLIYGMGKPLKEYAILLKLFNIDLSLTKDCVPTRICVDPSSMASLKSPDIPIDK